jgi:hypothetical protein
MQDDQIEQMKVRQWNPVNYRCSKIVLQEEACKCRHRGLGRPLPEDAAKFPRLAHMIETIADHLGYLALSVKSSQWALALNASSWL